MDRRSFITDTGQVIAAGSVALSALGAIGAAAAQPADAGAPTSAAFRLAELLQKREADNMLYYGFFKAPTLHLGIYHLKAGAADPQFPHNEDEIYYVIDGKAVLEVEGEALEASPGSILYVRAKAKHKFRDIESPLTLLVFFSTAPAA